MKARRLAVEGAFEFTTTPMRDPRGAFVTPLDDEVFTEAVGHRMFPIAQGCVSHSSRGVFRGVHFSATPPGRAKYVWCVHGRCHDVVIDLRVGSPTFGAHEVVLLDGDCSRALYLPTGIGHAFLALEDDTIMSYLLSGTYVPTNEHALDPFDPALDMRIPAGYELLLSDRDRAAPSLEQARRRGLLPRYEECVRADRLLHHEDAQPRAERESAG